MDYQQPIKPYAGGRISGWKRGMDNRNSNVDIPITTTLRNGVNIDVLTSGKVRRRRGIVQVISDIGAHSLFSFGTRLLWATANALNAATANFAKTTLLTDTRFIAPLSFVELNGEAYFSNESINGKVNAGGTYEAWGTAAPSNAPVCASVDSSVVKDREHMVTCTFVLNTGEESGAPIAVKVLCGDSPIIRMTSIPQSLDARVVYTRIYVSDIDGEVLYANVDVPAGLVTYDVSGPFGTGQQLKTQFMDKPPSGQLIEELNGCIYIASGNIVYFTEPLRYGLVHKVNGFFMFSERVTMLKSVPDGMYVSADATYFMPNGVKDAKLDPVLPYRAIEGAACNVPNSNDVMWLSERGFVLGQSGGKAENVTEDRIAIDTSDRACMNVVEQNGVRRVIAVMSQSTPSPFQSEEYAIVEAARVGSIS